MTDAPSPFSTRTPNFQTSWDSTSLGWYKECPQKYKLTMLDQWTPRSKGVHLTFGGLYASGLEHYAHYAASGMPHDQASIEMVRWVLCNAGIREKHCVNAHDRCYGGAGGECPLCEEVWTPWSPGDHKDANIKNLYTLIRSLIWNVEERLTSPYSTVLLANGKPAVELSFSFQAFEVEGEPIFLSGHLDELVQSGEDRWVRDDKTTKGALGAHYFQQYSPNNQMSLYSVAGKMILAEPVRGVLVKAAQIGVNFTRFQTQQVPRPQAVLTEWLTDTEGWIRAAHHSAVTGHYPKNDKSCGNYGGCPFQKVCSVSPSHREAWLREDFFKSEWNPLKARGDV